ncbi:MAG: hypothetical protein AAF501_07585 [Pseudomonadota bacterium]
MDEGFETRLKRVARALPDWGDIQVLQMTDKQYENIVRFSDQARRTRRKSPEQRVLF